MTDLKEQARRLIELDGERGFNARRCRWYAAVHAPAIARDYLAKCEEIERLREGIATDLEADARKLRDQCASIESWLYDEGRHPSKSKEERRREAEKLHLVADGLEAAARQVRARKALGDTDV